MNTTKISTAMIVSAPTMVNCQTIAGRIPIKPKNPALANPAMNFAKEDSESISPEAKRIMPRVEMMKRTLTIETAVIKYSEYCKLSEPINKTMVAKDMPPKNPVTLTLWPWNVLSFDLLSDTKTNYQLLMKYFYYISIMLLHNYYHNRTIFVFAFFITIETDELNRKKVKVRCSYCGSLQIVNRPNVNATQSIVYYVTVFFSPINRKEQMKKSKRICCNDCTRCYEKIKITKAKILILNKSLIVLNSSLIAFKTIFTKHGFGTWVKNVKEIVQPDENSLHIIFKICKIKAFLDCHKVRGRFTIVTVERIL